MLHNDKGSVTAGLFGGRKEAIKGRKEEKVVASMGFLHSGWNYCSLAT